MPSSQVGLTLQSVANLKFRQTRSGRCFSPYDIIAIQTDLELLPMLMGASAHQESIHEDDDEGHALEPPSYSAFDAFQSPSTRHGPSLCHEGPKHTRRLSTNRRSCGSNNMKAGKRKRRCKGRQEKKVTDYAIRPSLSANHPTPAHLTTELRTEDLPATRGAYVGKSIPHGRKVWTLQELQADGYIVVPWDGITPHAILDGEGRIVAVLAGRPASKDWNEVNAAAANAMVETQHRCAFSSSGLTHRRGRYHALSTGISFGGGQQIPANLAHGKENRTELDRLLGNPAIKRLAGFGSSALAFYAPKLYRHFSHNITALSPPLSTQTLATLPTVLCDIHALGSFDPKAGGHLIFFDLKIAVEFPSGSTAQIPSAILRHGNAAVQPGETRFSFTQYFAGGLIRWVRYGFRSLTELRVQDPHLKKKLDKEDGERWRWGLSFFSKLTELEGDRRPLLKRKATDGELLST
ncbi:hypothetical protein F4604DRAFT_1932339 [Suillus subluteus]|nr:hypothetical protein F4604DRAFT_1932339 [Suillus subluteus]